MALLYRPTVTSGALSVSPFGLSLSLLRSVTDGLITAGQSALAGAPSISPKEVSERLCTEGSRDDK